MTRHFVGDGTTAQARRQGGIGMVGGTKRDEAEAEAENG